MEHIGIIGAGAWGTALAATIRRAGRRVTLWAREPDVAETLAREGHNPWYLPGVTLPDGIAATSDPATAAAADALLLVVPAQHLRGVAERLAPHRREGVPLVVCAKGIEQATGALMSEAVAAAVPGAPVAVLSGPTFAGEVAAGLPTAVTLACADAALEDDLVHAVGTRTFRPYFSDDVIGAQVGGAVKNVMAIACGIVHGRRLGENARAALITRGLAELTRLATALGGRPQTLMGLSGLGDLTLTCNAMQSRNFSLGAALGEGQTLAAVLGERCSVAEGVYSAGPVTAMGERLGVELPVCQAVDGVLNHDKSIDRVIQDLLARPFRAEAAMTAPAREPDSR